MHNFLSSVPFALASGSVDSGIDTTAAKTAVVNGFKGIAADMISTVTDMLPYILGVVGFIAVIMLGIKVFQRLTKKS